MTREPSPSSPRVVVAAPQRSGVPHPFEVVFDRRPADTRIVLRSATDANEATIAFHEALRRLTLKGATGELLVRNGDRADHPLLRLPLPHHR
jgi:hypothetical protein